MTTSPTWVVVLQTRPPDARRNIHASEHRGQGPAIARAASIARGLGEPGRRNVAVLVLERTGDGVNRIVFDSSAVPAVPA